MAALERRLFKGAEGEDVESATVANGDVEEHVILMPGSPFELRALEVALVLVNMFFLPLPSHIHVLTDTVELEL